MKNNNMILNKNTQPTLGTEETLQTKVSTPLFHVSTHNCSCFTEKSESVDTL